MTTFDSALPSVTIKVLTPDGTLYVSIAEQDGKPTRVLISIGKAGSRLAAWADAVARLLTMLVKRDVEVSQLIAELSAISSDGFRMHGQTEIHSGPEGVAKALILYEEERWQRGV